MNKSTLIAILIGLVLVAAAFLLGRCSVKAPEEGVETKSDTIWLVRTDTIKVDSIVYKWKRVKDTIYLSSDTSLLVEEKVYEDSISTVYISGVNCELDSIEYRLKKDCVIINNETTITKIQKKHWNWGIGLGAYVGCSAGYNPMNNTFGVQAPEVGIGVVAGFFYTP